jgi:large subunit ribosomal protein L23
MVWRRLPAVLGNLPLRLLPLSEAQLAAVRSSGWLREAAFRTTPRTSKAEIKAFLEAVHGMPVERVHTINYLGAKKRGILPAGKPFFYRESDWKKAYVIFRPPTATATLLPAAAAAASGAAAPAPPQTPADAGAPVRRSSSSSGGSGV